MQKADLLRMINEILNTHGESKGYALMGITERTFLNYKSGASSPHEKGVKRIQEIYRKLSEDVEPDYKDKYIKLLESQLATLKQPEQIREIAVRLGAYEEILRGLLSRAEEIENVLLSGQGPAMEMKAEYKRKRGVKN